MLKRVCVDFITVPCNWKCKDAYDFVLFRFAITIAWSGNIFGVCGKYVDSNLISFLLDSYTFSSSWILILDFSSQRVYLKVNSRLKRNVMYETNLTKTELILYAILNEFLIYSSI